VDRLKIAVTNVKSAPGASNARRKALSIMILFVLIASVATAAVPVSASLSSSAASEASAPVVTSEGNYTLIVTDTFTVMIQRNGTKPTFVWWANNDTSERYVLQYKGLIEYAQINGSSFQMSNMAERELLEILVDRVNAYDLNRLGVAEKGLSQAFIASSGLLASKIKLQNDRADISEVIGQLEDVLSYYESLRSRVTDAAALQAIDQAIADTTAALELAQNGATQGEVADALAVAISDGRALIRIGIEETKDLIGQLVEQREALKELAQGFHQATLNFASCTWEMSEISNIAQGSDVIGLTFTMTLTGAPQKFGFAEGNVKLVVRIYSSPVEEAFSLGGQSYTYSVGAGEVKMDFVVDGWDWNFEPATITRLNTTCLTVSPALALWIDAAAFSTNYTDPEPLYGDLSGVNATAATATSFSYGSQRQSISVSGDDAEAARLAFTPSLLSSSIAGKQFMKALSARLMLSNGSTIGGFFDFVPYAVVTNESGQGQLVNVTASYRSGGNHVRIYVCYPYFNGTLVHDPSIGVEGGGSGGGDGNGGSGANYLVTLGAGAGGIASILAIPPMPTWGNAGSLAVAGGAVMLGVVAIILAVRRNPAAA
jgi:hypothetical protein